MATYLQGVTDYIPQIQPFTPDYNFYAKSLQMRQGKHDNARQQLSNVYGSLLNAPLTREDNSGARDDFFRAIDQDIQKMSGMDMSLNQNVHAAKGVFNQLLDNKNIVKDMVWTKAYQGQMGKAESFKNCIDPEKCGGAWWEGGEKALQYNRKEFMDADAETAMGMGNAQFVAYQDVTKMALALAKEADINVTVDQVTGQWITTTKNGPQLIGKQLQSLFMGSIGGNPKVKEYFNTKASNERKDFMYGNEEQYGSLDAAEQAYIQEKVGVVERYYGLKSTQLQDDVDNNDKTLKKIDEAAENAIPSKKTELQRVREEFQSRGAAYSGALEEAKEGQGTIEVAKRNQKYSGAQIDRVMAGMDMGATINSAAEVLSYRNYEQTVKVNPYGLESVKMKNRRLMEKLKDHNRMKQIKYKQDLKGEAEQAAAYGGEEANMGTTVDNVIGASGVGELDKDSDEWNNRKSDEFAKERNENQADISSGERAVMNDVIHRTRGQADTGDVIAMQDYVDMYKNFSTAIEADTEQVTVDASGAMAFTGKPAVSNYAAISQNSKIKKIKGIAAKMKSANTLAEKYKIAKSYADAWDPMLKGAQVDQFYEQTVYPLVDRLKDNGNGVLRDYLQPTWEKNMGAMRNIRAKGLALEQMDKWYADEAKEVLLLANSDSYTRTEKDALDSYINDKGHVVSESTFVKNMGKLGYNSTKATELFRGDKATRITNNPDEWGDGTYNWGASILDGIGTSIAYGFTLGNYGGDYDTPTDVANWDGTHGGRNDAANRTGRTIPGVHDMWRRAFTKHATANGDQAWMNVQGFGDGASKGLNYSVVDPKQYRSIATKSLTQSMKDGLSTDDAVFSSGGFQASLPYDAEDNAAMRMVAGQLLNDFATMTTAARPMANVTFVGTAAGDREMMGVNIKLNENYRQKYSNAGNDVGIMRDQDLVTDGFTIYIPKAKATNLFLQGIETTPLEETMKWAGELDLNTYPDYMQNFKIRSDQSTGQYISSGSIKVGLNEDGTDDWDFVTMAEPYNVDLNDLVGHYDQLFKQLYDGNKLNEEQWKFEHKNK